MDKKLLAVIIGGVIIISVVIFLLPSNGQEEDVNNTNGEVTNESTFLSIRNVESADNIGMKLMSSESVYPIGAVDHNYIYSKIVSLGQWNESTTIKVCIIFKSNQTSENFRNGIFYSNSSMGAGTTFQVDFYEYLENYSCNKWNVYDGGITYHMSVAFNNTEDNHDTLHELCINDVNAVIEKCASSWGLSTFDTYLTNIYQFSISSPITTANDYIIVDNYKVYVNDELVHGYEFNEGVIDNEPDDYSEWDEYYNAYATSIE